MYAIHNTETGYWLVTDGKNISWSKSRVDASWLDKTTARKLIHRVRKAREPHPAHTVRLVSINA